MKISIKLTLILLLIFVVLSQTSIANAYTVEYIPRSTNLVWRPHISLGMWFEGPSTLAAQTWNNAPGNFSFTKGSFNSGNLILGDFQSDVGAAYFSDIPGWPSSWVGGCQRVLINGRIAYFDILYNLEKPFGNGKSNNFADRQGVGTHEFGHALGLGDSYNYYNPPTMYFSVIDIWGENISYDMRTLEYDDRMGKQYIAGQI